MKNRIGISSLLVAGLLLAGCSAGASGGASGAAAPEKTVAVDAPKDTATESTFKDGTLTTPEMIIKITDVKTIPVGQKGNEYGDKPVIAFWYKTTNLTDAKLDPSTAWIGTFTAYQDNDPNAENKLNVGMLPDEAFMDSQLNNIKKGGTVANAVAYELSDTKTPVKLVASDDLGMTEIGSMTFQLK